VHHIQLPDLQSCSSTAAAKSSRCKPRPRLLAPRFFYVYFGSSPQLRKQGSTLLALPKVNLREPCTHAYVKLAYYHTPRLAPRSTCTLQPSRPRLVSRVAPRHKRQDWFPSQPSKRYQEVAIEDTALGERLLGSMEVGKKGGSLFFFLYIFHKRKLEFSDTFFISALFSGFSLLDYRENIVNLVLNLVRQYGLRVQS
jgi:hypothetical protein